MSVVTFVVSSKENRKFQEIKDFKPGLSDQYEELRELCRAKEGILVVHK